MYKLLVLLHIWNIKSTENMQIDIITSQESCEDLLLEKQDNISNHHFDKPSKFRRIWLGIFTSTLFWSTYLSIVCFAMIFLYIKYPERFFLIKE